jgi:hypothetical protein
MDSLSAKEISEETFFKTNLTKFQFINHLHENEDSLSGAGIYHVSQTIRE